MGRLLSGLAEVPVSELDGVGEKSAAALAEVGVESVLDLLMHYPLRHHDRTRQVEIRQLRLDEEAMVLATVKRVGVPPPAGAVPASSSRSSTEVATCAASSSISPGGQGSCRRAPRRRSSGR